MAQAREFIFGPWRAVTVLGVTQILTWGILFYPPVLTIPLIAKTHGWSISFAMGGFSFALLAAGLAAPYVGRSIDRYGGHVVMTIGSLLGALGLVLITVANNRVAYVAVWILIGVALSASLMPAFCATVIVLLMSIVPVKVCVAMPLTAMLPSVSGLVELKVPARLRTTPEKVASASASMRMSWPLEPAIVVAA